jgi:hypothetical protein
MTVSFHRNHFIRSRQSHAAVAKQSMTNTVFDKTDQGRDEIATRAHHLAPRLRTLLLLVDGKRDTMELMAKVAGLGLDEKALAELLDGGFIRVAAAALTNAPATAPIAAEAAPALDAGSGAGLASTAPSEPMPATAPPQQRGASMAPAAAAVDNPALPTGVAVNGILREGETQFQALNNFFNETIRSAIGLRGFGMQLKVERAASIADFRALRQPYLDAVLKAKGPELEHSLRNRLDQLLGLGD